MMSVKAFWTIPRVFICLKAAAAHTWRDTGGMINVWASVTAYDIAHIPAHMAVEEVAIIAHERLYNRKLLFSNPPTAMTPATPAAASSTSAWYKNNMHKMADNRIFAMSYKPGEIGI